MKVTHEDLTMAAKLSRLSIDDEEAADYLKDFNAILTYFENLETVPTDDIEPSVYALPMSNVFRDDDEVRPSLTNEEALANAPEAEDGYFKVPRVLNE